MEKPIFIIAFILLILVLGVIFVWQPEYQNVSNLRFEIRKREIELQTKEKYFSKLEELSNELKEYKSQLAKIDTALPEEPLVADLLNFLEKTARESGLILGKIGLGNITLIKRIPLIGEEALPEAIQESKEMSLIFSLSGSYPAFKNFLSKLQSSARLIRIESISFLAVKIVEEEVGREIFTFDLGIKVYSY